MCRARNDPHNAAVFMIPLCVVPCRQLKPGNPGLDPSLALQLEVDSVGDAPFNNIAEWEVGTSYSTGALVASNRTRPNMTSPRPTTAATS